MEKLRMSLGEAKDNFRRRWREAWKRENVIAELRRFFPILVWLPKYTREDFYYDIVAGLTVGITMVPQCLAYGALANLRPEVGLHSSIIGQFIYILMGTSKDGSVGPDAVICMITGQIVSGADPLFDERDDDPTCATILALITGIALLLMAIFKLGFIANLFSIPVVSGFMTAAGITITASQLKSLFGLKKNPASIPGVFVKHLNNVATYEHYNNGDLAFGFASVGFLLFIQNVPRIAELLAHRFYRLDNDEKKAKFAKILNIIRFICACKNVILFILSTGIAYGIWRENGGHIGASLVGYIKPGMMDFHVPPFAMYQKNITHVGNETIITQTLIKDEKTLMSDLTVGFIILPLIMMMELFAILKALGSKNGYRVDARQELLAIGLSNIVTGFLGGMPITAAVTRAALNDQCRVRTQVGSIISVCIVIISLNALTPVFYFIPKATLGAVVLVAALNLIDIHIIPDIYRHAKGDFVLLIFTILVCVLFEISYGVLFCLFINMIIFLKAVVRMDIQISRITPEKGGNYTFGDQNPVNSIAVIKVSHGMKYPSVEKFLCKVEAILAKESHVIIDCTFVQSVDYTGIQAFRSLLLLAVKKGLHVVFTNLNNTVHHQLAELGLEEFKYVSSIDAAIGEYNKAVVLSELEGSVMDAIPEDVVENGGQSSADLVQRQSTEERAMMEKARQRLIRRLSVQPSYVDVPLTVAGNVNYDGDEEEDPFKDQRRERRFSVAGVISSIPTLDDERHPSRESVNIQFLNRVLLRELSRNSNQRSIRGSIGNKLQKINAVGIPSALATTVTPGTSQEPAEIMNAIQRISASPAAHFIDMSQSSNELGDDSCHSHDNRHSREF